MIDLWTGETLGVHADHWPPSYSAPTLWGLTPHAHRLVEVVPQRDIIWDSDFEERRAMSPHLMSFRSAASHFGNWIPWQRCTDLVLVSMHDYAFHACVMLGVCLSM